MATCLAAGLYGIEKKLKLAAPSTGDAGDQGEPLPRTLKDATAKLKASKTAHQILGAGFVDHYVRTREWEVRQYDRQVTEWELSRYFESI